MGLCAIPFFEVSAFLKPADTELEKQSTQAYVNIVMVVAELVFFIHFFMMK
jgi:hypothetical protein